MPIDPRISLGVKPVEIANPLAQYGQMAQIQNYQQANQLNALKMQETQRALDTRNAVNQAYSNALDPKTGKVDFNKLRSGLATGGFGAEIPAIEKGYLEMEKERAGQQKAQTELVDTKLKQSRQFLGGVSTPDDYIAWNAAQFSDPVLGPVLRARGLTPEQTVQRVQQAIAQGPQAFAQLLNQSKLGVEKFMEMNKPTTQVIDQGGQRQVVQIPGLGGTPKPVGTYADVPLPADVMADKVKIAQAGASNVTVSTDKAYGGEVAKGGAEEDLALFNTAQTAPRDVGKIDETLDVLRNQDINTGIGAELFNALDKARGQFLADKEAGKRVTSTEYLDSLLGSDVFPLIQSLGIGARGMDTPAEREFLRKVMTGTISLNKETLIKMAERRRKAIENEVGRFNDLVDKGALDDFFVARKRPKGKVSLPEAPKGAAAAQSPQYAVNPSTGERIVSTDGGQTWKPTE